MTITEFVLARIAEDEEVAYVALNAHTDPEVEWDYKPGAGSILDQDQAAHVFRWSPRRVLAECEAKRRIVEDIRDNYERPGIMVATDGLAYRVLEHLAVVYVDHADYREEWKP